MRGRPESETAQDADARARYGASQAAFVQVLVGGAASPTGFDEVRMHALSDALVRKRCRAVTRAWPALARSLGGDLEPAFVEFARSSPPPAAGATADGLAFASSVSEAALDDAARLELLLGRARYVARRDRFRNRRTPFVGLMRCRGSDRSLLVIGVPVAGTWMVELPRRGVNPYPQGG
jgi:hypothetical protein